MKYFTAILLSTLLVLSMSELEGVAGRPFTFNSFLEAVGVRRRTYRHGTYIPTNGQEIVQKPLSNSEEETKIIASGIGAVGRECPEGTYRSESGTCLTSYAGGNW